MKNKFFFLLALPVVWLLITFITTNDYAGRVGLFAVAPSVWLLLFIPPLKVTLHQMQFGGLAIMFIIGFLLLMLKVKPHAAFKTSLITTAVIFWLLLIILACQAAILNPLRVIVWLFCCFNLSLCLLPLIALSVKLFALKTKIQIDRFFENADIERLSN